MLWFFVLFVIAAVFMAANEERIATIERAVIQGVRKTIKDATRGR